MNLCDRCRREILEMDYPPEIDVGTHIIQLPDGSMRRLYSQAFEVIGILWPRRHAGYLHRDRLHQLLYGSAERASNTLRMAIHYTRHGLCGSNYKIETIPKAGYRIVERDPSG